MEFSWNHRKENDTRKVPKFGSSTVTVKNLLGESIVVDKRSEWLKRLKIQDTDQQILVCSLHLSVDDYVFPALQVQPMTVTDTCLFISLLLLLSRIIALLPAIMFLEDVVAILTQCFQRE